MYTTCHSYMILLIETTNICEGMLTITWKCICNDFLTDACSEALSMNNGCMMNCTICCLCIRAVDFLVALYAISLKQQSIGLIITVSSACLEPEEVRHCMLSGMRCDILEQMKYLKSCLLSCWVSIKLRDMVLYVMTKQPPNFPWTAPRQGFLCLTSFGNNQGN